MGRRPNKESEEVSELRRENADLKRTVARLRRELHKFRGSEETSDEDQEVAPVPPPKGPKCSKCSSHDLRPFATPSGQVLICSGCKTRHRQ